MKLRNLPQIAIGLAMLAAAGLAVALTPHARLSDTEAKVNLEKMIPEAFADWKEERTLNQLLVNPEKKQLEERVYDQTLARLYVNAKGQRVMLSIAYGGTHGEDMQPHRPEVCYPSQGFSVVKENKPETMHTKYGDIEVKRLVAAGPRTEPITYWVVVGDSQTQFGLKMKLLHLRYNLTGQIPDGMLVRVSSIGGDEEQAYSVQERFIDSMLAAIKAQDRPRIIGQFGS
jgi:EpsI family protein